MANVSTTNGVRNPPLFISALFLGPKGENLEMFNRLALKSFEANAEFRRNYFPSDFESISQEDKNDPAYRDEKKHMEEELEKLCTELKKKSVPFGSTRFQSHMIGDTVLPGNLGYLAGLFFNGNNHVEELSPATTNIEIEVTKQLCELLGYENTGNMKPWGHMTCGGTLSNIDSIWSCQNVKYYPLAVQKAIKQHDELSFLRNYEVFVPWKNRAKKLLDLSKWELLNLDIDVTIQMLDDLQQRITEQGSDLSKCSRLLHSNTLANAGWNEFMKIFGLSKQGVICMSTSNHLSWKKAVMLLGLGNNRIEVIPCDEHLRMDIQELRRVLNRLMKQRVPVISVAAVLGSTISSAVDDISAIKNLRDEFRTKGLNFGICVDAAWGGYFASMLHEGPEKNRHRVDNSTSVLPLNEYTRKQMFALRHMDTVTVDPHKSGFLPYPAGALCFRNGNLKLFTKITASYLFYPGSIPEIGPYGVQGSKPGAAATGTYLAHKVIGLDKYGYGAIFGQCNFSAKILYCHWLTLAKEDDMFICVPLHPLPGHTRLESAKRFINTYIIGKSTKEIVQNDQALRFLEEIGPDLCINAFVVNPKINGRINTNIGICNKVNKEILDRHSITREKKTMKRTPLIFSSFSLEEAGYQKANQNITERLGLNRDTKESLLVIKNTVSNPWTSVDEQRNLIVSVVRQTVLDSIGTVMDEPHRHSFISTGEVSAENTVFGEFNASLHIPYRQYQSIVKFRFVNKTDADIFRLFQIREKKSKAEKRQPVIIESFMEESLGSFLKRTEENHCFVNCFVGLPNLGNEPFLTQVEVQIVDVPRLKRIDLTITKYPECQTYFLYGDAYGVHLSHTFQQSSDFIQVVDLIQKPKGMDDIFIDQGIDIIIPSMPRNESVSENIFDPLTDSTYSIEYAGYNGRLMTTEIEIDQEHGKVWFNRESIHNGIH